MEVAVDADRPPLLRYCQSWYVTMFVRQRSWDTASQALSLACTKNVDYLGIHELKNGPLDDVCWTVPVVWEPTLMPDGDAVALDAEESCMCS